MHKYNILLGLKKWFTNFVTRNDSKKFIKNMGIWGNNQNYVIYIY